MTALRVLLVDDSQITRTVLARILSRAGYCVSEAAHGVEGAVAVFRDRPDVVVTDLEMPVMDGYLLLRLLKADPATAHIPVVVVTSHGEAPSRFWGGHIGADAYLTKDSAADSLTEVVHRLAAVSHPHRIAPESPPGDALEVLGRVARHLDQALLRSTIAASLMEQTLSATTFPEACRVAADVLADFSDPLAIVVGIAEADLILIEVLPFGPLALADAEALGKSVLHKLDSPPGTPTELRIPSGLGSGPAQGLDGVRLFSLPVRDAAGVLAVLPRNPAEFDGAASPLVETVLAQTALALDNARLAERLRELSCRDGLTRLLNHRAIHDRLGEELARAERHGQSLSLVLCDLDHFKEVNDRRGHLMGDAVLRAAASAMRNTLRSSDAIGRHGGEEFMVVLPETGLEAARNVAERLRAGVQAATITTAGGIVLSVTASFGIAARGEFPSPVKASALLSLADHRLYSAKAAGRNCVRP